MKRLGLSVSLGLLLAVGLPASSAPPNDNKPTYIDADGPGVLASLKDMGVVVERLPKDFQSPSLTAENIQADAEQKLKHNGLHVVPTGEAQKLHLPVLYININGFKAINGLFVYNINLSIKEDVAVPRAKNVVITGATVWQRSFVGATGELNLPALRTDIKDDIDTFLTDYQAANQKE